MRFFGMSRELEENYDFHIKYCLIQIIRLNSNIVSSKQQIIQVDGRLVLPSINSI